MQRPTLQRTVLATSAVLVLAGSVLAAVLAAKANAGPQLRVSGSKLVNPAGQQVVLHGVDQSGAEYQCVQGRGIFSGPADQTSITAMKDWGINAVRISLNEACWNSERYVNPAYAGARYRSVIEVYVKLLTARGLYVILDLHWSDGQYTGDSTAC